MADCQGEPNLDRVMEIARLGARVETLGELSQYCVGAAREVPVDAGRWWSAAELLARLASESGLVRDTRNYAGVLLAHAFALEGDHPVRARSLRIEAIRILSDAADDGESQCLDDLANIAANGLDPSLINEACRC